MLYKRKCRVLLLRQAVLLFPPDTVLTTLLRNVHKTQPLLHTAAFLTALAFHAFARLGSGTLAWRSSETGLTQVRLADILRLGERR
jgi:hypothetical protein